MAEISSEIEIAATAARVWSVLTDFERYGDWNPFITSISGTPSPGGQLRVRMHPPGGIAMTFKPKVLSAEPERELRWLGTPGPRGLFDGAHSFRIVPMGEGRVRFLQTEHFTGLLVPLLMLLVGNSTRRGFEAMNQALRLRAEQPPAESN
jgi:hypothetical protein